MKRILTALALAAPVILLILRAHPYLFLAVTAAVGICCLREFRRLASEHGVPVDLTVGIVAGTALVWAPRADAALLPLPLLAAMMLALRRANLKDVLLAGGGMAAALLYCFAPWRCAALLREIDPHWLLYALALNWLGDIGAFCVGSRFGRRKLAPAISPGKSWEGAAASIIFSVLFGVLYARQFLPAEPLWLVAPMTAVANAAGQIGDLCESAMKRGRGPAGLPQLRNRCGDRAAKCGHWRHRRRRCRWLRRRQ
jgi:phosphatidate cytidylyltransferase